MNQIRFSKLSYVLLLFVLVACQAQATPTATSLPPTVVPATSTSVPPTVTPVPTTKPLGEHVVAEWKVNMPQAFAFGFDSVWVPSHRSPNVTTRIDPSTNEVIAVIEGTGFRSHHALVIGDSVWVTGESDDLAPIDPKTNTVGTAVEGNHPGIAYGFNSIWGVTGTTDRLDRIDPATYKIIASIELGDGFMFICNNGVLVTASAVWVFHCDEGELIKIDPATNTIVSKTPFDKLLSEGKAQTTVPAGKGTDFIWLMLWGDEGGKSGLPSGLLRIDPNTDAGLTFLPLSSEQLGNIAVTNDAVWVGGGNGQINRVNVTTNQIDATYTIQPGITEIGIGFGSIWVENYNKNLVQRLDIVP